MTTQKQARIEVRNLCDLRDYPQQATFYPDLTEFDFKALKDDIAENGLRDKLQIMPTNKAGLPINTIIDGHQRRRALQDLGYTQADVIVRHDLAALDTFEVEREFLKFNLLRRQLDPLAKAHVARRLFEIEKKRPRGGLKGRELVDARDRVGKAIGYSGRNLSRLFNVLHTPPEVQEAFRSKKVSLVAAEKVVRLDAATQEKIVQKLRGGQSPAQVLEEFIHLNKGTHKNPNNAVGAFIRGAQRAIADLADRTESLSAVFLAKHLPELKQAKDFAAKLIAQAKMKKPPRGNLPNSFDSQLADFLSGRDLDH